MQCKQAELLHFIPDDNSSLIFMSVAFKNLNFSLLSYLYCHRNEKQFHFMNIFLCFTYFRSKFSHFSLIQFSAWKCNEKLTKTICTILKIALLTADFCRMMEELLWTTLQTRSQLFKSSCFFIYYADVRYRGINKHSAFRSFICYSFHFHSLLSIHAGNIQCILRWVRENKKLLMDRMTWLLVTSQWVRWYLQNHWLFSPRSLSYSRYICIVSLFGSSINGNCLLGSLLAA